MTEVDGYVHSSPAERALAWWAILTFVVFGATGLAIIAVYTSSGDICDEFHESPNTPLGWSIVITAAVTMAVIGWRLRPHRWHLLTAVAIVLHLMVYSWWITPTGTC